MSGELKVVGRQPSGALMLAKLNALGAVGAAFTDSVFAIKGSSDATKKLRMEVDGFTTGTTRVATFPNADITVAGINLAQTFTATQTFAGIDATSIGATTRGTGLFTTLGANGATTLTAGTASTSTTTGTLVVTGGGGFSGALWVGGLLNVAGATSLVPSLAPAANADAYGLLVTPTIAEASSGTHAILAGAYFSTLSVTSGAASVTDAATVYIQGQPAASGATNLSLFIGSGLSRLRDKVIVGSLTTTSDVLRVRGPGDTNFALHVDTAPGQAATYGTWLEANTGVSAGYPILQVTDNAAGSTYLRVNTGGTVLVGGTTDDGVTPFQVNGAAKVSGALTVAGLLTASAAAAISSTTAAPLTVSSNQAAVSPSLNNTANGNAANNVGWEYYLKNASNAAVLFSYLTIGSSVITAGSETATISFGGREAGTNYNVLSFVGRAASILGNTTIGPGSGSAAGGASVLTLQNSTAGVALQFFTNNGSIYNWVVSSNFVLSDALEFIPSTARSGTSFTASAFTIYATGSVTIGPRAALATNATAGFVYMPTCAGTPTGTPTAETGKVAWVYDTTNNIIYVYNGAWKKTAALT